MRWLGFPARSACGLALALLMAPGVGSSSRAAMTSIAGGDQGDAGTKIGVGDTIDLATLQKLLAGLGYQDVGNKKTAASIAIDGAVGYSYNLDFQPSDDKKSVVFYIRLKTIPKDKMPGLPMLKMLHFNDTNITYFSIATDSDGSSIALLNTTLNAGGVTPVSMRLAIEAIVSVADRTHELWDPALWTGGAGAARN